MCYRVLFCHTCIFPVIENYSKFADSVFAMPSQIFQMEARDIFLTFTRKWGLNIPLL
jgi:hypothetical protein